MPLEVTDNGRKPRAICLSRRYQMQMAFHQHIRIQSQALVFYTVAQRINYNAFALFAREDIQPSYSSECQEMSPILVSDMVAGAVRHARFGQ